MLIQLMMFLNLSTPVAVFKIILKLLILTSLRGTVETLTVKTSRTFPPALNASALPPGEQGALN